MLCTCKQIHHEAEDILYLQPLIFDHQKDIISFSYRSNARLRRLVEDITIRVHEADVTRISPYLGGLENQKLNSLRPDSPSNPYAQEVGFLTLALSKIGTQIKHVSVLKPLNENKTAPCDYFQGTFIWVKENYHSLESLHLGIDKMPLTFLPSLTNLKMLHFSGYSVASPEETLQTLKSLPRLEELRITGPPRNHTFHQRSGFRGQLIVQSLTPDVLERMQPLKRVSIHEIEDPFKDGPSQITTDMLKAIRQSHAQSLSSLSITANMTVKSKTLQEIHKALVESSNLIHVELAWFDMDPGFLKALPVSIKHLSVLVGQPASIEELLIDLRSGAAACPSLRSICFLFPSDGDERDDVVHTAGMDHRQAILRTEGLPWSLGWRYWKAVPSTC